MRTVLHAIDTWGPGGAETVCVDLAARLDSRRYRSVAAVIRHGWVHDAMQRGGLRPVIVKSGSGPIDLTYLWSLARTAKRNGASIIQTHLLTANLYGAAVGRLLGIPCIATFHGTPDLAAADRWAHAKLRLIAANVFRLVFVSEALRRHFAEAYAVKDCRTTVIPNGVDPTTYRPDPHLRLRRELGIGDDVVLVGAVGNIRPAKAYDELLRVATVLRDHRPNVRFIVAGEPSHPLYDQLLARRHELQLDDRVAFLGFRSDIASILNGVDLYVSTSTSEGFSLTTVQAMACGLPVVVTRSGGPEEIVTHGEDGVLVPVGDAAGMAKEIADLAASPAHRRRLGERGRGTVVARFTTQRMVSAYEAVYAEALDEAR